MNEKQAESLYEVAENDNGPTPIKVQCHACGSWWVSRPFQRFNCLSCDAALEALPAIELVTEKKDSQQQEEVEK